ncbi:MAG: hypothetical protein H6833_06260 [Planctomycetes bacterium]|nr:hypothetical protein [Planctomycetota bacterium]
MKSDLQALIHLWELDRELRAVQADLERYPAEEARRQAKLDVRRKAVERLEEEIRKRQALVKDVETDVAGWRDRIKKLEMESMRSRDNDTLYAYQHQVQTLKQEIGEREEDGLKVLDEITHREKLLEDARKVLAEEQETFQGFLKNVARESEGLRERAEKLEAERAPRTEGISVPAMELYERLISTPSSQPMAELTDRTCQGCFTQVTLNEFALVKAGKKIVQCSSCRKILFIR